MKNGKFFNNYLFLFFSFLFSCFGIFFDLQEVNASTQTNKDINLYTDFCYYENDIPNSFINYTDTNFDLTDTPYWFITVSRNNDTTLNYSLYSISTSNIFFDLTGGTFYYYTEDTSTTFNLKYFSCSSALAYADSEVITNENQNSWVFKWETTRDFTNSSWNRSAFRKWFDSDTVIDYNDFITYLPNQEQGASNTYLIASNFDIYNSNNELVLKKTYDVEIIPPPGEDENEESKIEDTLTDTTLPDNDYSQVSGWLPPGPLDTLVNIPFTILNLINNELNNSCMSYKMTFLFNSNVEIPCVMEYLLTTPLKDIINFLDVGLAVVLCILVLVRLYKYVENLTKLNDNNDLGGVM